MCRKIECKIRDLIDKFEEIFPENKGILDFVCEKLCAYNSDDFRRCMEKEGFYIQAPDPEEIFNGNEEKGIEYLRRLKEAMISFGG